jgi:hypothetical protein
MLPCNEHAVPNETESHLVVGHRAFSLFGISELGQVLGIQMQNVRTPSS